MWNMRAPARRCARPGHGLAVLVLLTLGWVVALAPAGSALASEPRTCKTLVLDPAHHIDVARVTKAAQKVQAQAADIRVRVYDSVPDGDLDAYMRRLNKQCSTWQDGGSGWKNNLVVLALDVGDRRSGLYYGDTFGSVLDQHWTGVQADAMNPRFKSGDYTGGLVAGLTRVAGLVDPDHSTPAQTGSQNPQKHHRRHLVTAPADTASTGSGGGWAVGLVLLGLIVVAGAVFGGVRYRRHRLATAAARGKASAARGEMTAAFLALEESSELTRARVGALPAVDDSGVGAARDLARQAEESTGTATTEYLAVEEADRDEAIAMMKAADATAAGAAMTAVAGRLTAASKAWAATEQKVDELEQLRTELPAQLDTVDGLITSTRARFGEREAAGFRTHEFVTTVDGYAAESAAVRDLLSQMRFGDADGRADALLEAAHATQARVDDLPALQARLMAHVGRLRSLAAAADADLAAATTLAQQLATAFQSECTEGLDEALAAAADEIAGVRSAADQVEAAASMSAQRFTEAEAAVAAGDEAEAKAAASVGMPAVRKEELEALSAGLQTQVKHLQTSRDELAAQITDRADAVAFLRQVPDVAAIGATLAELYADVTAARPALYTARDGITDQAGVLAHAQADVDATVALFDKATKRVAKAEAAVSDAESESGRMHSGSTSKSLADDANDELERARAATDLQARIEHADAAVDLAAQAVEAARSARRDHQRNANSAFGTGAAIGFGAGALGGSNSSGLFGGGGGLGGGGMGGGDMGGGSSGFGGGGGGDMGGGSSSF